MQICCYRKRLKEGAMAVSDMKRLNSKRELQIIIIHSVIRHGRWLSFFNDHRSVVFCVCFVSCASDSSSVCQLNYSRDQSGRLYSLRLPVIYFWMLILLIWYVWYRNSLDKSCVYEICYQMNLQILLNSCVYEDCWWFPFNGDRGRTAERTGYELHSGVSREATYQSGLVKRHHPVKKHSSAKADTSASLCDPPFAGDEKLGIWQSFHLPFSVSSSRVQYTFPHLIGVFR